MINLPINPPFSDPFQGSLPSIHFPSEALLLGPLQHRCMVGAQRMGLQDADGKLHLPPAITGKVTVNLEVFGFERLNKRPQITNKTIDGNQCCWNYGQTSTNEVSISGRRAAEAG